MKDNIVGIQQVGVGIPDVLKAWEYYRKNFNMDVPIFQESAEAKLMTKYTGGKVHSRSAVLAINLNGGSGLEIWQYTSRESEKPKFEIELGDLGIFITKIKAKNVEETYSDFKNRKVENVGELLETPNGEKHFYLKDLFGNIFEIVQGKDWFRKDKSLTGGVCGVVIGVSNMEKSLNFYKNLLGYDKVIYEKEGVFEDLKEINGGTKKFKRILLERKKDVSGTFSRLLGTGQIELVQSIDKPGRKIFEGRYWGDQGFIHLCFDVYNMKELEKHFEQKGHPFTIDSNTSFDMGEAAGHFTYCEDPDGTWIEFVETYRIPILKIIGWYLNVGKRDRTKPLPDWMLGALRLTRVKN